MRREAAGWPDQYSTQPRVSLSVNHSCSVAGRAPPEADGPDTQGQLLLRTRCSQLEARPTQTNER